MDAETIAEILLEREAVSLRPKEPFTFASGIKSPIYCDNRLLLSFVDSRERIIKAFLTTIKENRLDADVICGTATAGIPWAAMIADSLDKPLIYARNKAKEHGKENVIEGRLKQGQKVLLIEDMISTGGSSVAAVQNVKSAGGKVIACIAIFTYGMKKARDRFEEAGCLLFTLTDFETLVNAAVKSGYIERGEQELVLKWSKNPEAWRIS